MLRGFLWPGLAVVVLAAQASLTGPTVLTPDPAGSRLTVIVGKAGVLGFAGHIHEVTSSSVTGRIVANPADWRQASVSFELDASSLRVTGKDEPPADVPQVQRVMEGPEVLDVARFPRIAFRSRRVSVDLRGGASGDAVVDGEITLHGTTRPVTIRAAVSLDGGGRLTARGQFSLKQSDFGIRPVTAAGGTIRVKDELDIHFLLSAVPDHAHHQS